jgi:hypothetical protein
MHRIETKDDIMTAIPTALTGVLACVAATLTQLPAASAADFTFRVPIVLENMPPVFLEGFLRCFVFQAELIPGVDMSRGTPRSQRALGSTDSPAIKIPAGRYETTMTVEVNVRPTERPSDANYYECGFLLRLRDPKTKLPMQGFAENWVGSTVHHDLRLIATPDGYMPGRARGLIPR